MQNFSILTLEILDLEQFKAWNLYRVSQSDLLNACKIMIAYARRLKFGVWIFFYIYKLFVLCQQKLLANWRNLSLHIAATLQITADIK